MAVDFKSIMEAKAKRLVPWAYCWELPCGVLTGDSAPNLFPEKMVAMIDGGAFQKPMYKNVLDLGANSGYISMWFADYKGSTVTAIEKDDKYFAQLRFIVELYGYEDRIFPIQADATELYESSFAGAVRKGYDLVLCLGLLHNVAEKLRPELLKVCATAVKVRGEVVVQTDHMLDVPEMLRVAGLINVKPLYEHIQERSAWVATRPMR